MRQALIAFGANLGSPESTWNAAVGELESRGLAVEAVSRLHATSPVGGPADQPGYLNAAAIVQTHESPRELLARLREVELRLGRARSVRWAPRTIDLDLLLVDQLIIDEGELSVPHPRMAWRRFVLDPAAEIAAEWRHPLLDLTVGALAGNLHERPPLIVWLRRQPDPVRLPAWTSASANLRFVEAKSWTGPALRDHAADDVWTVVTGTRPESLVPATGAARLVVWDHHEWPELASIAQVLRGCAVMDLARASGSACDDLAAAIQAMS